jgi:hypothetical protein
MRPAPPLLLFALSEAEPGPVSAVAFPCNQDWRALQCFPVDVTHKTSFKTHPAFGRFQPRFEARTSASATAMRFAFISPVAQTVIRNFPTAKT